MVRHPYRSGEVEFLIGNARKVNPDDIVAASGDVFKLHREVCQENGWPKRSRGTIANKLYMIKKGYEAHPLYHPTPIKFRADAVKPGSRTKPVSHYTRFESRVTKARETYKNELELASKELAQSFIG